MQSAVIYSRLIDARRQKVPMRFFYVLLRVKYSTCSSFIHFFFYHQRNLHAFVSLFVITISLVFVAWNEYFHGLANWNARKLSVSLPLFSWEWLSRDIIRMEIFETSCCIQLLQFEFSRKNILLNVPRAFF